MLGLLPQRVELQHELRAAESPSHGSQTGPNGLLGARQLLWRSSFPAPRDYYVHHGVVSVVFGQMGVVVRDDLHRCPGNNG